MADRQSAASIDTALRVGEGCTATSMLAHPGASGVTLVICSTDNGTALDWPALAHSEGSLVICLGRGRLLNVAARLIAAGMPPETPAAVIALGAPAGHGHVVSTLGGLPTRAAGQGAGGTGHRRGRRIGRAGALRHRRGPLDARRFGRVHRRRGPNELPTTTGITRWKPQQKRRASRHGPPPAGPGGACCGASDRRG
ncbi:MAG TPA: hypothetical protein PL143_03635 [Rhodocyclaceae bacterium]|nr:hypothetical protein [Rhodocyclaceae bacterium]